MRLLHGKITEARGDIPMAELARRIAKRDPYHLGTTGAQQIRRWEAGQRPRFESETIAAIAAETGQPVSFFYSTDDDRAASDDEEAAPVAGSPYEDLFRAVERIVAAAVERVSGAVA